MDARDRLVADRALGLDEDVDALAAVDVRELLGAEPADHERADREERDVAEVEQAAKPTTMFRPRAMIM